MQMYFFLRENNSQALNGMRIWLKLMFFSSLIIFLANNQLKGGKFNV
jgi:hypothetical protein